MPENNTHQLRYYNLSNRQVVHLKIKRAVVTRTVRSFYCNCDDIGNTLSRLLHVSIFISAVQYVHLLLRLVPGFHTLQRTGNSKNRHIDVGQVEGQNTHSEDIMNNDV